MTLIPRTFVLKRAISLATTMSLAVVSLATAAGHADQSYAGSAVPVEYLASQPALAAGRRFCRKMTPP